MPVSEHPQTEQDIQYCYTSVPRYIKDDLYEAIKWAKNILAYKEGPGHKFNIKTSPEKGLVFCSFAKPEWSEVHVGRCMALGSEAIVIAVCEYLNGV